jgi:hypothetical protein
MVHGVKMRLWSIHPKYLDSKGLLALWREGLLALNVLQGRTKGYRNHPQLDRFQAHQKPIHAISSYLHHVVDEAEQRGYAFKRSKLPKKSPLRSIKVAKGQLGYELLHLKKKLKIRDKKMHDRIKDLVDPDPHPLFTAVEGEIEAWEKV